MAWTQGQETIEDLIRRRHLELVPPNPEFAHAVLTTCEQHVRTAEKVADEDPVSALQTAYDAARKALTAILHAQGLRPTSGAATSLSPRRSRHS